MRIRFEQSGGLIGKSKTLDRQAKEFSDQESAKIRELVRQCDFFDMPEPQQRNIPNARIVMMQIETDEGRSRTIVVSRETAPPALKELIKMLEKYASYS